jgi:glycine cleavage system transcriptional repressor
MSESSLPTSIQRAVISGIGPDRPGIVASVSEILFRHGCNIEDSTMTLLANEFAIILLISMPQKKRLADLQLDLNALEASSGLVFLIKPAPEATRISGNLASTQPYMVSVTGDDCTGITHRVSRALAELRINITDLNAQVIEGENGPLYIMMVEVSLPDSMSPERVRVKLKPLAQELGVEVHLRPLEAVAL